MILHTIPLCERISLVIILKSPEISLALILQSSLDLCYALCWPEECALKNVVLPTPQPPLPEAPAGTTVVSRIGTKTGTVIKNQKALSTGWTRSLNAGPLRRGILSRCMERTWCPPSSMGPSLPLETYWSLHEPTQKLCLSHLWRDGINKSGCGWVQSQHCPQKTHAGCCRWQVCLGLPCCPEQS